MLFRSDLAAETVEALDTGEFTEQDIRQTVCEDGPLHITVMDVISARAGQRLQKPCGRYITAQFPSLSDNGGSLEDTACRLAGQMKTLLPEKGEVVVAGLGNGSITPDALGPKAASMILATRHIRGELARCAGLCDLRPTAVLAPGVLGQTGVESGEIIRGLCGVVKPAAVIVIDALACRSLSRLGCTVQACDAGIAPGSGVGNHRRPLNAQTLGVPVIAIGVPTVVDAATVAMDLTGCDDPEAVLPSGRTMMVTPREIDLLIDRAARLVAMTVNKMLQPDYSPLDLAAIAV